MINIFKSDTISLIAARDIDTYGQLVAMNRKLAQRGFRKTLQRCFVYKLEVKKYSKINGYCFDVSGVTYWLGYALHNENGPAIISNCKSQWYLNGVHHRINGPAIIRSDGHRSWCLNGKYHRTNGPARIWPCGTREYHQNGKLHRTDGPAIIHNNGTQKYYRNGELHRDDGPAAIYASGPQIFYQNGEYRGYWSFEENSTSVSEKI